MSGGSDKAQREAQANEQARLAAITGTQSAVNGVFNSPQRAADIADYVGALRTYYGDDLNEQKANTDRQLKFALARGGLTGGSTQIDQQKTVGKDYAKGLLNVDRKARGAGAELEASDQDARARLISLATSGLDATTAASMAASSMRSNLESGKSAAQLQGIGDAFGGPLQNFFKNSADAAVRRRAVDDAYGRVGLYQSNPNFGYGGTK
jgi:hypothetical protein